MIWAYDTRSGDAVQMIGRSTALVPGTCPSGCWTERHDGKLICVCGDTLFKARSFLQRRSLSGGAWDGGAGVAPVVGVLVAAAAAFGGVYWLRQRGWLRR